MYIKHVEFKNYRKLFSVRLDLSAKTTLLVGANNSGKTSAMLALRQFLIDPSRFCLNDFTLEHWPKIRENGETWRSKDTKIVPVGRKDWVEVAPTLDLWLEIGQDEIHYVSHLIPTLDWKGGLLGVRLQYEPKDLESFRKDFATAHADVEETKAAIPVDEEGKPSINVKLWPENIIDFLERKLRNHFAIRAYILDPTKLQAPVDGQAIPQVLDEFQEAIELEDLRALIRIDEIDAQRGFGHVSDADDADGESRGRKKLSTQLRTYFARHLNPSDSPDISDLSALEAIETAQKAFDDRLDSCFKLALDEVQSIGYPGVTDPKITISTRLHPVDGLNHDSAVQYRVDVKTDDGSEPILRLPEDFNGLGYQNLISMIFRMMSFRDAWMRVGKASKGVEDKPVPPLHLVLVEEPEAHLHAQVQQVFAKKAYDVLRRHPKLGKSTTLSTQLVISSHSSHVAHELPFSCLRYFRRLPAGKVCRVPVSTVINLREVFGNDDETNRFVTRYLKAHHCDLFFADAAILVEGPAERMLVPHFIRLHFDFLNQCYITLLEIGGSHAHRLRPLIDHLGLLSIVITDLDSMDATGGAAAPKQGGKQTTNNDTLKKWVPARDLVDELLEAKEQEKICSDDGHLFAVRAAYQTAQTVTLQEGSDSANVVPYTFEDALAFANVEFFKNLEGNGLVAKFRSALGAKEDINTVAQNLFTALRTGSKAEFVLDVINAEKFEEIVAPPYIAEALAWLQERLRKKQAEVMPVLLAKPEDMEAQAETGVDL
jgi:predicted ATP-dependent endonuclease of OLD family